MHVVDIEAWLDGAEDPPQRSAPVFVGEFVPVALDTLGVTPAPQAPR
jgi:hypothetical protein